MICTTVLTVRKEVLLLKFIQLDSIPHLSSRLDWTLHTSTKPLGLVGLRLLVRCYCKISRIYGPAGKSWGVVDL